MMKTEERQADKEKKPRDIKERTFSFASDIVHLAQRLDERSGVSRALERQLLRSGTSIGANVEEAQAGQSHADFSGKYAIAFKEILSAFYFLVRGPESSEDEILLFSSDFSRLANALSAPYPTESKKKRFIRALLRGATAMPPGP